MKLRNLTRTFSHLSLPKKLAVGAAVIAGGGVLISIPMLSFRPPSSSPVFNEEAYYKSRINQQNQAEEKATSSEAGTNLDTTTPVNLFPVPDESSATPDGESPSSQANTQLDATDTPSGIKENPLNSPNTTGNLSGNTNNPYSQPSTTGYTAPKGLSSNPYSLSQPTSGLSTPYSSSQPTNGLSTLYSSQAGRSLNTPYGFSSPSTSSFTSNPATSQPSLGINPSAQPSLGNSLEPSSPGGFNSPGVTTNPSNLGTAPGTTSVPNESGLATNSFNGSSGNSSTPPTTSTGGYMSTPGLNTTSGGTSNLGASQFGK